MCFQKREQEARHWGFCGDGMTHQDDKDEEHPTVADVFLILVKHEKCVEMRCELNHGVKARGIGISEEKEDLELIKRQLKILNKPAVKSFVTEEGDIHDCVDIHKQPALDHPLLKNHKIQMRPSSFPRRVTNETSSSTIKSAHIKLKRNKCPPGTVPIRRTSKEDLIRAKSLSREFETSISQQSTSPARPQNLELIFVQRVSLKVDDKAPVHGASAIINVYNPPVRGSQFSTAQIWVQNGPYDKLNMIQAGWMVYPDLYHDNQTRLFTYWTGDGSQKTGCYNTICNGFVQTDRMLTPSSAIKPVSVYGGPIYEIYIGIYQDQVSGNWWLVVTSDNIHVGYWPKNLFPDLSLGADSVVWGALTQASADGISPPMGSGHFPFDDHLHSCYARNVKYVNKAYQDMDLVESHLKEHEDNKNCYDLKNDGFQQGYWRNSFRFGGPGGKCN
ncbi:uncharacterized protein LOC122645052 [Telopea speciosissima]|uniref:uncharacterized protein LOC122645052 n=1 Tax=Telopea speciosissima TaxID=54955 RepID=UPI001CC5BA3C|nr:uncharacterized protein LOC122645052 [Telopea speciosissima]